MQHHVEERCSDEELEGSLPTGDDACPVAIHRRWSALGYGLARRSPCDAGEAEDVTQQLFLGVRRGRHGYRPEHGPPADRIASIARRRITDALPKGTRRASLAQLPPPLREILHLAFHEDLTQTRIAARTGWPLGAVRSHALRGPDRLRHLLGPLPAGAFDAETVRFSGDRR
ncbi:sigma factor-like helix-turn-helix DNA-binding protein [Streptomyces sp. NPDC101165]|uniref:sigma factor-like helix-turn-helix DNA-binding protein n=1 Tax=Streptomyces sp. NPDC101165 TaxID=3366119 RepID=UPI00380A5997